MIYPNLYRYLDQDNFLDTVSSNSRLSEICTNYLAFECFNPLMPEVAIASSVKKGEYSLQDYAISNWIQHVQNLRHSSSGTDHLLERLSQLWKKTIASRYLADADGLGTEQTASEVQSSWIKLEDIQSSCDRFGLDGLERQGSFINCETLPPTLTLPI